MTLPLELGQLVTLISLPVKPGTSSIAGFHGREKDGSVAGNEGTEWTDPLSPGRFQRLIFCALVAKSPFLSISHDVDVNGNDSHWRVAHTRYLILNAQRPAPRSSSVYLNHSYEGPREQ